MKRITGRAAQIVAVFAPGEELTTAQIRARTGLIGSLNTYLWHLAGQDRLVYRWATDAEWRACHPRGGRRMRFWRHVDE